MFFHIHSDAVMLLRTETTTKKKLKHFYCGTYCIFLNHSGSEGEKEEVCALAEDSFSADK